MAKELEKRGAHILAIKDMSGLLKPYSAKNLVVRPEERRISPFTCTPTTPPATSVATTLMAAEAGVDIATLPSPP